jgi:hypothetical protein
MFAGVADVELVRAPARAVRTKQKGTMNRAPTGDRCEHDDWRDLGS